MLSPVFSRKGGTVPNLFTTAEWNMNVVICHGAGGEKPEHQLTWSALPPDWFTDFAYAGRFPNSAAKRFSPVRVKLTTRLPGAGSRAAQFSSVKRLITAAPSVPAR